MKYYKFNKIARDKYEYCDIHMVPEGMYLEGYMISEGERVGDDYPENARINMSEDHPGIVPSDFVSNTESALFVSAKMKEIIETFCPNVEIEYLPFTLYNHKGRVAATDYWIINVIGALDCLDMDACDITWSKRSPGKIVGIDEFVLSSEKLKEAPHLFRIKEAPREYVVSEDLANAFMAAKLTNINLDELEVK